MARILFTDLWNNHPYPAYPCDQASFPNQCAIRIGVALRSSGVDLSSFPGAFCYPGFGHNPRHILRAQELADWLRANTAVAGAPTIHQSVTAEEFRGKQGIVFVQDGWGATDHIDAWDGVRFEMKGGQPGFFALGRAVWFWEL
jgi:hypothetical protein